ncbi:MAG: hypothetical protein AB1560_02035 [Pseudomonadota bacterium]
MNDEKDLLASKVTWGVLVPIIVMIGKQLGFDLGEQQPWVDGLSMLVGGLLILWGRVKAVKRIGSVAGLPINPGGTPPTLVVVMLLAAMLSLGGCAAPAPIIDSTTATTPAEKAKLQAMEAVAQSEKALTQAWAALGEQARNGVLFKSEVQAIEAQLDKAGTVLDEAHAALKNGLWDLASGKAGESGTLTDTIHAQLGKYLKERRKEGAKP